MSNFYAHDHTQSARSNPNVVPLSSRYTRVDGGGGTTHAHEGVKLATGTQQRPYEAPARRFHDNTDKRLCAHEGCRAWPMIPAECCSGAAAS